MVRPGLWEWRQMSSGSSQVLRCSARRGWGVGGGGRLSNPRAVEGRLHTLTHTHTPTWNPVASGPGSRWERRAGCAGCAGGLVGVVGHEEGLSGCGSALALGGVLALGSLAVGLETRTTTTHLKLLR